MNILQKELKQIELYLNHPRAGEFKGFIKEQSTGYIYPFLDVLYADNKPRIYSIIAGDEADTIDADCVNVIKI
ncbi:hypothetical protein [Bacillus atrophaeus]|uniref:hypothetical protein n=1 Tax=Bacillus atrophaeus TaxID=1452 RepID=UPI002E1B36D4|nr:hypothetical protein [Bacillus atrophaeus]